MFCRHCGSSIPSDSAFCPKCGKRVAVDPPDESGGLAARLHLKTPWPWAALLFAVFLGWTVWPASPGVDMSTLAMALELEGEAASPEDHVFRHYLSLVVENRGTSPVGEIPVEFGAQIVSDGSPEIVSEFRGGRFVVVRNGRSLPLVLVLADEIAAEGKRRFPIDNVVTTDSPAEVTYTVRAEGSPSPLAVLSVPVGEPETP